MVDEQDLRTALRPFRPDPAAFEAAVRERMRIQEILDRGNPLTGLPPTVRAAAAFLPLPLLTGGKVSSPAASLGGSQKLLGALAFPAISLFLLFGATVFGLAGIRSVRNEAEAEPKDTQGIRDALVDWRLSLHWSTRLVFPITLALMMLGASDVLFAFYIVSFGILVYVLRGLARLGLGNRAVVAGSCYTALGLLGGAASGFHIGAGSIHLVDQRLVGVVFWLGALALLPFVLIYPSLADTRLKRLAQRPAAIVFVVIVAPILTRLAGPLLWPTTPQRIKSYVESFDSASNSTSSWSQWEIPARWTVESGMNPDLSKAHKLLDVEIAGEQHASILSTAFRVGLVRPDQVSSLRDLNSRRRHLMGDLMPIVATQRITFIDQYDWAIRALVLTNDLSAVERDFLAARLHVTLQALADSPYDVLRDALVVTQLLDVIDRPVDTAEYREQIHNALRERHCTNWGGFQFAGGFKQFAKSRVSDPETTAFAVELMETYGVPDGLDLNWVRSYVRPRAMAVNSIKWINDVTRMRLNSLPGVQPPPWWQVLYFERNLLAAAVLVALCIYAVALSPSPRGTRSDAAARPAE